MLAEAEQVEALVMEAQAEPHGRIRFSCPTGMLEQLSRLMTSFLSRYPKVRLKIVATDRAVDLIEERIDLALRVRTSLTSDAALTMRSLGASTRILVASLRIAIQSTSTEQLTSFAALPTNDAADDLEWHLQTDEGRKQVVRIAPRLGCEDMATVRDAATHRLGAAVIPDHVCRKSLEAGQLVRVLPEWHGARGIVHLVFTTRQGLPPAVRALIDHLAAGFPRRILGAART
jgi:DNA-binding transcriptional LysR family regulator